MLKGRLDIDSASVPRAARAGLLGPARGGTLAFRQKPATGANALAPGSTVDRDALRPLACARTALAAVGEGIDLSAHPRYYAEAAFPRARGDRPWKPWFSAAVSSAFPARAGIDRMRFLSALAFTSVPRARGDRPG